jgi:ubiquitin conjugation factor E4 B
MFVYLSKDVVEAFQQTEVGLHPKEAYPYKLEIASVISSLPYPSQPLYSHRVPHADQVVARLAGMLNFNMMYLMGPRAANLDMEALKKYNFDPMRLLGQLTDIYVQCATPNELGDRFAESLVGAARYDANLLNQAAHTLRSLNYDSDKVSAFEAFVARVKVGRWEREVAFAFSSVSTKKDKTEFFDPFQATEAKLITAEEDLGEVPEEFLDPIM